MISARDGGFKMKPVFTFDAYKTIVDCPEWDRLKQEDSDVRELFQKFQADRARWSIPFMAKMDEYIARGIVGAVQVPGTRETLERLSEMGALAVYSTATEQSLPVLLESAGLGDLFPDTRLVIPVERLDNIPKTSPQGFRALDMYVRGLGFMPATYTDDEASVIMAAMESGVQFSGIQSESIGLYHLDRNSALMTPEPKGRYHQIQTLNQMLM